ncbi:hypothetical protein LCGC14_2423460 [marine sediment metagenome]|uniref:Uncharacterized protein n=1 Tax=marine sediment metagenome TaxID=412755 RepID=A0A0F9E118_9ZZZZ
MKKTLLVKRFKELNVQVTAWAVDGTIPVGSEKEVFLLLLAGVCKGESLNATFDV